MTRCFDRPFCAIFSAILTLMFLGAGDCLAQDQGATESTAGNEDDGLPELGTAFDDATTFVAPADLPIVDVPAKTMLLLSEASFADQLTTVSITSDGDIEEGDTPDSADVLTFSEMLKNLDEESTEATSGAVNEEGMVVPFSVIGPDTRTQVGNTKVYPFRAAGRIDIGCTGTLVGPRHVLTAAHCVYNIRTDKWYKTLSFSPGQSNSTTRPYGKIDWKKVITVKGWTQDHDRNHDYAMIILKSDIGNTVGTMGYGYKNNMPKYSVNINGYPADKPNGTMWHSFGKIQIVQPYRLYHDCDTFGGNSGSGVYVYFSSTNERTIYGVHAYGVDSTGYNGATRIDKNKFEKIKKWVSDN